MKSQKTKEFIDGCMAHLAVEMNDHAKWQLRTTLAHVAEIAEQEAEERIREKAIDAFKSSCMYQEGCLGANMKCDPDKCKDLKAFIQKLTEE